MSKTYLSYFDSIFIDSMNKYGVSLLRISLAIVYIWFGLLKVIGISPVTDLIKTTYSSFPEPSFIVFLGYVEIIVGIGLLLKLYLRIILALLWIQMAGIFFGFFLTPSVYFINNNLLLLSSNGEFVVKNFVLVAASLVIGGQQVQKMSTKKTHR